MNGAVAPDKAAAAPQEREWRWFVLGLVLMVVITAAPVWPPALALLAAAVRLLLPVEQFALLVLIAIAACATVGWLSGGRILQAVLWLAAAGYVLWRVPLPLAGYGAFLRGWALTLGAAFGLVSLASPLRPLLSRALAAVALAGAVTVASLSLRAAGAAGTFEAAGRMFAGEYQHRLAESLGSWHQRTTSEVWQIVTSRFPRALEQAGHVESLLVAVTDPNPASAAMETPQPGALVSIVPALLALESILALALGWAAYHRLARTRIGPPIGALRDLRFNDQWVWGLIVGITALLLPTLAEWQVAGINLLGFFGALYALRGASVLTWWIPDRVALWSLPVLLLLVLVLGPVWVLMVLLSVTFTLGLGDTWRDFRSGAAAGRHWSS